MKGIGALFGAVIGALFGLLLPSGLEHFSNGDWINTSDPQATITAAVIGLPLAMITTAISSLICGLFGMAIGFIIELANSSGGE